MCTGEERVTSFVFVTNRGADDLLQRRDLITKHQFALQLIREGLTMGVGASSGKSTCRRQWLPYWM